MTQAVQIPAYSTMKKSDSEVNCGQHATLILNQNHEQHSNAQMGPFFASRGVYPEVKVNPIVVYQFVPFFSQKNRELRMLCDPDLSSQSLCTMRVMKNLKHHEFRTSAVIAD